MGLFATLQNLLLHIMDPWIFMGYSAIHIPATIRALIATGNYRTLFSPSGFHEALFGTFWATVGPDVKTNSEKRVIPLLEGRVKNGLIHDEVISTPIHGTVLEVGAGSGMWADVLARFKDSNDAPNGVHNRKKAGSGITKIYGVEPNPISAKALQKRVKEVGLGEIYEVVPVGIESVSEPSPLWDGTIEPGSVDCIFGVLCLCSIPEPEKNIKLLYKLLKPGGHWYVYEHVKVRRGGLLLSLYQRFVNIPWSFFIGSCRLCRDTEKSFRGAGVWQEIDLVQPQGEPAYQVLPHIMGTLTK